MARKKSQRPPVRRARKKIVRKKPDLPPVEAAVRKEALAALDDVDEGPMADVAPEPIPIRLVDLAAERLGKMLPKRRCERCGQTGCYEVIDQTGSAATIKCRGCQKRYEVDLRPSP